MKAARVAAAALSVFGLVAVSEGQTRLQDAVREGTRQGIRDAERDKAEREAIANMNEDEKMRFRRRMTDMCRAKFSAHGQEDCYDAVLRSKGFEPLR